jgi:hypothetical protein
MRAQSHLMTPLCVSKRKKVLRRLLPLSLKFKQRRSHKRKQKLKVALKQRDPIRWKLRTDLKDKPESDEPKKESLQKEINGSAANEQVSNKFVPDVSIPLNTQIPDERQVEVGPTRHNEEVQEPNIEQVYTTDSLGNMLTWGDQ